ncbi:DUF1476 domain-containing protein [Parvularcula sp. IMCC14364]|uniref:DUF1476 domain-containing protein n=1 Tax=Parvularcula sp. IMCC14364 TaxID=3067902 RepID=UPI00274051DC|nr:DUF1476 domain-containing protein [Parvularcula sp. IMCC14364]
MNSFDDRQDRFEKEFAHSAELQFKVDARRNKLVGLWAAELLGKSGDEAAEYAKSVVIADLEEAGDEDVFRKLRADLDQAPKPVSDKEIRSKMDELMPVAKQQIRDGA